MARKANILPGNVGTVATARSSRLLFLTRSLVDFCIFLFLAFQFFFLVVVVVVFDSLLFRTACCSCYIFSLSIHPSMAAAPSQFAISCVVCFAPTQLLKDLVAPSVSHAPLSLNCSLLFLLPCPRLLLFLFLFCSSPPLPFSHFAGVGSIPIEAALSWPEGEAHTGFYAPLQPLNFFPFLSLFKYLSFAVSSEYNTKADASQ